MPTIPVAPKNETRRISFNYIEDLDGNHSTVILPPLYMHHNPQSLSTSFKKKTTRIQTFDSFVEFYWGEELDTISGNALTGGFYKDTIGLTTFHRKRTEPFFKFQDVLDIYKHNGNTYDEKGRVVKKGNIILFFDPDTYFGYFESFNYREDATNPYNFFFDFTFRAEKSFTGF